MGCPPLTYLVPWSLLSEASFSFTESLCSFLSPPHTHPEKKPGVEEKGDVGTYLSYMIPKAAWIFTNLGR
jgi:hypothetical protein